MSTNGLTKFGDLALAGQGPASEGCAPGGPAGVRRMDCRAQPTLKSTRPPHTTKAASRMIIEEKHEPTEDSDDSEASNYSSKRESLLSLLKRSVEVVLLFMLIYTLASLECTRRPDLFPCRAASWISSFVRESSNLIREKREEFLKRFCFLGDEAVRCF